jgi:hypothetical protein
VDNKLFTGDYGLYCIDIKTGTLLWHFITKNSVECSPAVADGRVYITSVDGNVYCFGDLTYETYIIDLENEVSALSNLNQELEMDISELSSQLMELDEELAENKALLDQYEDELAEVDLKVNAMNSRGIPLETIILGIIIVALLIVQYQRK